MQKKFVTVAAELDIPTAQVCKSHLKAHGIKCFLENENFIAANPLLSNAVGWVKIKVFEEDVPKAREILKEMDEKGGEVVIG
jgi:hypothetical protein